MSLGSGDGTLAIKTNPKRGALGVGSLLPHLGFCGWTAGVSGDGVTAQLGLVMRT